MADVDYDGWAPCVHKEEDKEFARGFLDGLRGRFYMPMDNDQKAHLVGGDLECMIWQLTDLTGRGDIQFDCDQWWGVFVTGQIYTKPGDEGAVTFKTRVQGDTLLLAVAETLRWWGEKYKELRPGGE